MRKLLVLVLLFCSLALTAQTRVVKNPPFSIQSTATLEIDSIALNEQSTVIYLSGYSAPQSWIKIASDTYIQANGQKWKVESANGIELDKEVFPGQSGRRIFSLTFTAIPKDTKQIDFIEGDCEGCFKIWGIELVSPTLTNRVLVPQSVKAQANIKEDGKPLPVPILKAGDALLKGYLLGYRPEMESKVDAYFNNPISNDQRECNATVASDGSFELRVPMISTAQVLLRVSSPWYNKYIVLSPLKETVVYFDMQQMAMNDSRSRVDKTPNAKSIYFGGSNAEINNQVEDMNYHEYMQQFIGDDKIISQIGGMSANEFKKYMIDACAEAVAELADKKLTRKTQAFVTQCLQYDAMAYLLMGNYYLQYAYRKQNNIDRDATLTDYNYPVFEKEYYSFLKDYNVNNPIGLYSQNYERIVSSCSGIRVGMHSNVSITSGTSSEALDQLIKIKKLKGDELAHAEALKKEDYTNWSTKKISEFNQQTKTYFESLLATGKLVGRTKLIADYVIQLCNSNTNNVKTISEFGYELAMRIHEDKLLGEEVFKMPDFTYSEDQEKPNKEPSPEMEAIAAGFWDKYKNFLEPLQAAKSKKEDQKNLISILGANSGILFDMIDARIYSSKMEKYTPLSKTELTAISSISNPFYNSYLSQKNTELIALLKSREGKKLENVYDAPQVEDDKVLYEIVKPYEGKVILIDFWATWCGPCLSAMKQFEPTKKTFEGKEVVFIYLTDESSPMILWENMIPNIDGKHFRLKDAQLNYLKQKYGVKGIPSYLILNKKGEQAYFKVGFEGAERIGQILNDELAK